MTIRPAHSTTFSVSVLRSSGIPTTNVEFSFFKWSSQWQIVTLWNSRKNFVLMVCDTQDTRNTPFDCGAQHFEKQQGKFRVIAHLKGGGETTLLNLPWTNCSAVQPSDFILFFPLLSQKVNFLYFFSLCNWHQRQSGCVFIHLWGCPWMTVTLQFLKNNITSKLPVWVHYCHFLQFGRKDFSLPGRSYKFNGRVDFSAFICPWLGVPGERSIFLDIQRIYVKINKTSRTHRLRHLGTKAPGLLNLLPCCSRNNTGGGTKTKQPTLTTD